MFNSFKYLVTSMDGFEVFAGILVGMLGVIFAFAIFEVIGKALLFKKAGERWWKGLIPVYSDYILCKISGTNYMWLILEIVGIVLIGIDDGFEVLSDAISLGYTIVLACSISNSFGKDKKTIVGLILIPALFYVILSGRNSNYLGPVGCNDPIFKNVSFGNTKKNSTVSANNTSFNGYDINSSQNDSVNSVNNENVIKYCYGCGHKLSEFDRFCPGCGKEL